MGRTQMSFPSVHPLEPGEERLDLRRRCAPLHELPGLGIADADLDASTEQLRQR
jgi:hypothetical protein